MAEEKKAPPRVLVTPKPATLARLKALSAWSGKSLAELTGLCLDSYIDKLEAQVIADPEVRKDAEAKYSFFDRLMRLEKNAVQGEPKAKK